jgi:hypothetical protein
MSVAEVNNLTIYKGTYFDATFNLFQSDSSALVLNNLGTSYARVRKHPTSVDYEDFGINITTSTGTIQLTLTEEKTSRLTVGRNYFDVILTISSRKTTVLRGTIIVEESSSV